MKVHLFGIALAASALASAVSSHSAHACEPSVFLSAAVLENDTPSCLSVGGPGARPGYLDAQIAVTNGCDDPVEVRCESREVGCECGALVLPSGRSATLSVRAGTERFDAVSPHCALAWRILDEAGTVTFDVETEWGGDCDEGCSVSRHLSASPGATGWALAAAGLVWGIRRKRAAA